MNKTIEKKEIDLLDIGRIALKRKWIIILLAAVFATVVAVKSFTKTPMFRARARIIIEEPSSGIGNIQDLLSPQNYYSQNFVGTYFNTQLELLTSRTLAERVAVVMDLGSRPELQQPTVQKRGPVQMIKDIVSLRWIRSKQKKPEPDNTFVDVPSSESELAYLVLGGLKIVPVIETRLVDISYKSPHAALASDIVNALTKEFINYSIEMRYAPTQQASEFLAEQIAHVRKELNAKERELQKYGEEKGLLVLNGEQDNTIVQGFESLAKASSEAQLDRFKKQAKYIELKDLSAETIPMYIEDSVLQSLRSDYIKTRSEYNQKIEIFRPGYPEMIQLKGKMDSLYDDLQNELRKAIRVARSEYNEAVNNERSLEEALESKKQEVYNSNSDTILYQSLNVEVTTTRNLLTSLIQKKSETQVSARLKGLKTSNIKIIDKALVPKFPVPLNTSRNIILAIMLGVFLGTGIAFFTEYLDNTIRDPEEIEKTMNLPSLGVIPFVSPNGSRKSYRSGYSHSYGDKGKKTPVLPNETKEVELINHLFPNLSIAEDYRTIRTSIQFSHAGTPPKVITFSSAFPQEGKSAAVSNLAVSFAQLNKKVLIVDGDLRRPRQHKIFKARNNKGLSNFLAGKITFEEAVQITAIKNLWIIPSGPNPPNPAELMDSDRMKELLQIVRDKFDVVLIDSPPVLAVIDPIVLGSFSDSLILVVRSGKTTKKALAKAVEEVRKASTQIIGIIYNEVKAKSNGTQYYSPSYQSFMDEYYEVKDTGKEAKEG
ncbi:MAG: polysaccharide biosynthesis tyrosine autokinase [Candidatus Aminicenantes bacterium]|nr:polysaccharide biosynthesis tyrosine autokinase [Candidatus Aminicenantes bacterium]